MMRSWTFMDARLALGDASLFAVLFSTLALPNVTNQDQADHLFWSVAVDDAVTVELQILC